MTQPTHGLIDGDIIVYRVGFASEDVTDKGIVKARVDQFIDDIMERADLMTVQGFITATGENDHNFRKKIATTKPYKGNRSAAKPVHYDFIREYLAYKMNFAVATDCEADDMIGITATTFQDSVVICSIDKDLRQVSGWHYNFVTKKLDYIDEVEGNYNFYTQVLTGDRTDNVPGLEGIGPVKAAKILDKHNGTAYDMYCKVQLAYAVADHKEDYLYEQARLLWILRQPGVIWTPPKKD